MHTGKLLERGLTERARRRERESHIMMVEPYLLSLLLLCSCTISRGFQAEWWSRIGSNTMSKRHAQNLVVNRASSSFNNPEDNTTNNPSGKAKHFDFLKVKRTRQQPHAMGGIWDGKYINCVWITWAHSPYDCITD